MTEAEIRRLWDPRPESITVLGHRGICAKYPENTMISFEAAIALGVDLIEFDINVTKDGEPVVIHDNTIDRTSDHTGLTRDYTLAELKTFDFGCRFGSGAYSGQRIPTLRELLTLVTERSETLVLNVEIKDMTEEAVDKTTAMLTEFGLTDRCVIACFDAAVIRYVKAAHPEFRTQGFPGRYMSNFTPETYDCMFGMGIPISWGGCTEEQILSDIAFANEKGILPWLFVADTEEAVERCVRYGTANITGNNPEVALTVLRKLGLHR